MRLRRTLPPLFLALALVGAGAAAPAPSVAQVAASLSITVAPPALPVYAQPVIPGPGYIWTPGYWAWGPTGYYWVPGTWVLPPAVGLLWTPGYWGWTDGAFVWHAGYWGPHVGFYGGVNYGFGYTGVGYAGGYWAHGAFFYNRAVNNVRNVANTHVYNKTVVNNVGATRVSYNGGTGGLTARPSTQELAAMHEAHRPATALQAQHERGASANPTLRASFNHGHPAVAATQRPAQHVSGNAPQHRAPRQGQHPGPRQAQHQATRQELHPAVRQAQDRPALEPQHQPLHQAQHRPARHPPARAAQAHAQPQHAAEAPKHGDDNQHHG